MSSLFLFNDTATTEIYTLSLHDALPISGDRAGGAAPGYPCADHDPRPCGGLRPLRRGPAWRRVRFHRPHRLGGQVGSVPRSEEHTSNSSHAHISYAVFCLEKKKK